MWCGARDWVSQIHAPYACPGNFTYLCAWVAAPGYGNGWNQMLVTDDFPFQDLLTFTYHGYFNSEPHYDQTFVEYDAGGGNWIEIATYDGVIDTIAVHELLLSQARTKLRFHFTSDGVWSDEDGLWDTDGAFIVDSITISDVGGTIDYENFESYTFCIRDTRGAGGIWYGDVELPYGNYSGLVNNLADKDPCGDNFATQVVFFIGSPYPSSDYPGLFDVPFCKGPGNIEAPCQDEAIISPVIDMNMYSSNRNEVQDTPIPPALIPQLGGTHLRFTVYRDLPLENLVFYTWGVRNIDPVDACPGLWLNHDCVYYGSSQDYHFLTEGIGDLVGFDKNGDGYADPIQLSIRCIDMCDVWYGVYGDCADHTPSPWIDNVRIYSYVSIGPQWSLRLIDLFQDNFPENALVLESYIRADASIDLRPASDPIMDLGDSVVVTCNAPRAGGIDTTIDGWPKVYCHVYPKYIGDPLNPKPTLYGPQLEGTYGRYTSDDGDTWTILQCDYARIGDYIAPNKYMMDLNDSLFTRGHEIYYYFSAYDKNGQKSTMPAKAQTDLGYSFSMSCLPSLNSDILLCSNVSDEISIDNHPVIGPTPQAFEDVTGSKPDQYENYEEIDKLLDRIIEILEEIYKIIIEIIKILESIIDEISKIIEEIPEHEYSPSAEISMDGGGHHRIGSGTIYGDRCKSELLIEWLEHSMHEVGLWICGDDIAYELARSANPAARELLSAYCGVEFVGDSYFGLGSTVNPLVKADPNPGNPLWHGTHGDSFYVFGGCPIINRFDYLEKTGTGEYALQYPDVMGQPYYAGIYNAGTNSYGYQFKTMWFGFDFECIRDAELTVPIIRNQIIKDILIWIKHDVNVDISEADEVPAVNSLGQNFPNPFNPATTIEFSLKTRGHVSIKIYDVSGRLVKTLVDGVMSTGPHKVIWDGTNNRNAKIASGVYFYRMNTGEFEQTRKTVLLR